MSLPLKQAIIRKNRLRPSKVMNNLVRACIAGNAKNKQNRPTLSRDFSATARDKKFEIGTKISFKTCTFRKNSFGTIRKWSGKFCPGISWNFPTEHNMV
jgi:hypothetical protein